MALTADWIPLGLWNLAFLGLEVALGGFFGLGGASRRAILAAAVIFGVSLGAIEVMAVSREGLRGRTAEPDPAAGLLRVARG